MRPATTVRDRHQPLGRAGRGIVEFALRAPSVHNTQPWRWQVTGARLDLYADRSRQLRVSDPLGRNMTISCGAALEYAVVGAAAGGWHTTVDLEPEPAVPEHLARILLAPGLTSRRAVADASLLASRATDRRRLIPWPVPAALLHRLAGGAGVDSAVVVPLVDLPDRIGVELLVSRAMAVERSDPALAEEETRWLDVNGRDGIPPENARPDLGSLRPMMPSRFDEPVGGDGRLVTEPADGLLVIVSGSDDVRGWLDAGRALCRIWAAAMDHGLALVPLSQVVEVTDTRAALRIGILGDRGHPQLLLRLGWQELARSPLPLTPRRSVDDVLMS